MEELAALHELVGRAGSYASLRFAVDTADPAIGALLQQVQERATAIQTTLLFFELEWAALDDERAEALLADRGLAFCAHHLRSERRYRPHLLSEPEERILNEKAISARSAWARLFAELMSSLEVHAARRPGAVSLEQALARLSGPDRDRAPRRRRGRHRRRCSRACARAPPSSTRCCTTRRSTTACAATRTGSPSRNLANEASDESVEALVSAVRARYDVPQRWYRLKARLLGVERLADYDRAATVATADERFAWSDARELVLDAYGSFSPRARRARAALLRRALDRRAGAPRQARRRLLLLHGPVRASRTCCSTTPRAAATC